MNPSSAVLGVVMLLNVLARRRRGKGKGSRGLLLLVLLVVLAAGLGACGPIPTPDPGTPPPSIPEPTPEPGPGPTPMPTPQPTTSQQVIESTVQIRIVSAGCPPGALVRTQSRSLGTLVDSQGTFQLYTHNHYETMNDADVVVFYNATGELLGQTTADDFRQRMSIAQSPGNAVIIAPEALLPGSLAAKVLVLTPRYAQFGSPELVSKGDILKIAKVSLTQLSVEGIGIVSALDAEVDTTDKQFRGGTSIFGMHTSLGITLVEGNSGGGVWLGGRVVGNIWSQVDGAGPGAFQAAQLPNMFRQP